MLHNFHPVQGYSRNDVLMYRTHIFNSFPTTDVYTRVYYHPSDRID